MKKNLLKIYEGFFDDLDKLNKNLNKEDKVDNEFGDVNGQVYDEHNYILSHDRNPEFFKGLCNFCRHKKIPYNENGFTQNDLDIITYIKPNRDTSYFNSVVSLDELQYFRNLERIYMDAFFACCNLKSIIFPKNLKKINIYSFMNCLSLEKVIFPKNIEKIEDDAFGFCSSLKEIIIPEKFKDSIEYIFDNVDLTKVNITYI